MKTLVTLRTLFLTAVTLIFFAANSLLARLALRGGEIDAGSFTAVRILAGAVMLAILVAFHHRNLNALRDNGTLRVALILFAYAILFSFAYLSLSAGTGALVLFATVQITMHGSAIAAGEHPRTSEWIGLSAALAGLVYLVLPGLTAPSPIGVMLMAASGVGWGYYSMAAKGIRDPITANAGNFARAAPLAAGTLLIVWTTGSAHVSLRGLALAAICGAVTTGLGYAIWYTAIRNLPTSRAAIVQLTVPVLAATGGILALGENLTWRLALASAAILGGVALALSGKTKSRPHHSSLRESVASDATHHRS